MRLVAFPMTRGKIELVVSTVTDPSKAYAELSQHMIAVRLPAIGAVTIANLF